MRVDVWVCVCVCVRIRARAPFARTELIAIDALRKPGAEITTHALELAVLFARPFVFGSLAFSALLNFSIGFPRCLIVPDRAYSAITSTVPFRDKGIKNLSSSLRYPATFKQIYESYFYFYYSWIRLYFASTETFPEMFITLSLKKYTRVRMCICKSVLYRRM